MVAPHVAPGSPAEGTSQVSIVPATRYFDISNRTRLVKTAKPVVTTPVAEPEPAAEPEPIEAAPVAEAAAPEPISADDVHAQAAPIPTAVEKPAAQAASARP